MGLVYLIIGFLLLVYASIGSIHSSTARAMGAQILKIIARVVGIILLLIGIFSF